MAVLLAIAAVLAVLVTLYAAWLLKSQSREGEPPYIHGGLPYLGVAIDFAKDAVSFLRQLRDKHGEVFTVLLAGKRLTFLTNTNHINVLLKGPSQLDFIVDAEFCDRVVGTTNYAAMTDLSSGVSRHLVPSLQGSALIPLTDRFLYKLQQYLDRPGSMLDQAQEAHKQGGWVKQGLFSTAFNTIT